MAKKFTTSPKGELQYPHLVEPDTKFDAEGAYSTKLVLSTEDAAPMLAELKAEMQASEASTKADLKRRKVEAGTDKTKLAAANKAIKAFKVADAPWSEDEETDTVTFNFKMKASGKTREGKEFTQRPTLVDRFNKPVDTAGLRIGSGTIARVAFESFPFYTALIGAGISLRLRAVQIIELKEWQADGARFGFEVEEGDDSFGSDDDSELDAGDEVADEDADSEEDADF